MVSQLTAIKVIAYELTDVLERVGVGENKLGCNNTKVP